MKLYLEKSQIPSTQDVSQWISTIKNLIQGFSSYKISLSKEERQKRRKIGPRRIAYTQAAVRATELYEQAMPRNFQPTQFRLALEYYENLRQLQALLVQVTELMSDTSMAVGIDLMTYTKLAHDAIRGANNVDPIYDDVLAELDEFNEKATAEDNEPEAPTEEPVK